MQLVESVCGQSKVKFDPTGNGIDSFTTKQRSLLSASVKRQANVLMLYPHATTIASVWPQKQVGLFVVLIRLAWYYKTQKDVSSS